MHAMVCQGDLMYTLSLVQPGIKEMDQVSKRTYIKKVELEFICTLLSSTL